MGSDGQIRLLTGGVARRRILGVLAGTLVATRLDCARAREAETLLIGHIGSLSGLGAAWGTWDHEGIVLAIDEINASGGVEGRRLVLVERDDGSKPAAAAAAFRALVAATPVCAVIGGTSAGPTMAMAPLAKADKTVLISPSAQPPPLGIFDEYAAQVMVSTEAEGQTLGRAALKMEIATAAIFGPAGDYGDDFIKGLRDVFGDKVRIVGQATYPSDLAQLPAVIDKTLGTDPPDAVFAVGMQKLSVAVFQYLADKGIAAKRFAGNSFQNQNTIATLGNKAEGVIYDYPGLVPTGEASRVTAAFRARYGRDINVYNALGYDTVNLLTAGMARALKAGERPRGAALVRALRELANFPGITGPISYGGETERPIEVRTYRDGRFVTLPQ